MLEAHVSGHIKMLLGILGGRDWSTWIGLQIMVSTVILTLKTMVTGLRRELNFILRITNM